MSYIHYMYIDVRNLIVLEHIYPNVNIYIHDRFCTMCVINTLNIYILFLQSIMT